MAARLIRTCRFQASHRYWRPEWTGAENRHRFGSASEAPGHSHDYRCTVTIEGPVDPATGMIVDLGVVDGILASEITGPLQGRSINEALTAFGPGRVIPTCEALARYFFERIGPRLPEGARLRGVRVDEDDTLGAEYLGEEG